MVCISLGLRGGQEALLAGLTDMHAGMSTVFMQGPLQGGSDPGIERKRETVRRLGPYVGSPYSNIFSELRAG